MDDKVTITKKEGEIEVILDSELVYMKLQFNPWTLDVTNYEYKRNED
jgi:hypothetical protein